MDRKFYTMYLKVLCVCRVEQLTVNRHMLFVDVWSMNFTCVNGKFPFLPFSSPSH